MQSVEQSGDKASGFSLGDRRVKRPGYGAMQLAGPGVFGPPRDRDAALAVLREAVAAGVDHIDTSDFYGPHVVNKLIREALAPYPRDLVIVTKVGALRGADGSWNSAQEPDQLRRAVEDNLRHLGLERLEVVNWRIHPDDETRGALSIAKSFGALATMQRGHSYAESRDGGATWSYSGKGLGDMVYLYGMAIDPANPDDVRVAASASPRAAHGDNGPTWKSAARSALSRLHLVRDSDGPSSIFRREGDLWIEDADGFPRDHSLIPILATDPRRPGQWFALSNLGLFSKAGSESWQQLSDAPEWIDMHPMCLMVVVGS